MKRGESEIGYKPSGEYYVRCIALSTLESEWLRVRVLRLGLGESEKQRNHHLLACGQVQSYIYLPDYVEPSRDKAHLDFLAADTSCLPSRNKSTTLIHTNDTQLQLHAWGINFPRKFVCGRRYGRQSQQWKQPHQRSVATKKKKKKGGGGLDRCSLSAQE